MDLFEELLEVCKKHNTTISEVYWALVVDDCINCNSDFESTILTDKQTKNIVNSLLNNDNLWNDIDYHVYETISSEVNNK